MNAAALDRLIVTLRVFEETMMTGAPEGDAAVIAIEAGKLHADRQFLRRLGVRWDD